MENNLINYFDENKKLKEYEDKLVELRQAGVNKISELKQDIASLKRNKLLNQVDRDTRIDEAEKKIADARAVAARNKNVFAHKVNK